jgi:outer membrane protein
MEEELKKKGAQIEEEQKRLEREAMVMNKEKRVEKERELRIKINDFKALQKNYTREFKEMEAKLVRKIRKSVYELVGELGKKEGFLLILEKHESGVVFMPDTVDITDQVIKLYNESLAAQN